jgi:hypothetical protein
MLNYYVKLGEPLICDLLSENLSKETVAKTFKV